MLIKEIFMIVVAVTGGIMAGTGVSALVSSIGIFNRITDKTRTAGYIRKYETCVLIGATVGSLVSLMDISMKNFSWIGVLYGLFSGIYIGCLSTALAEALKATATFTRRLRLHKGIEFIVLSMALGKMTGAFLYFIR